MEPNVWQYPYNETTISEAIHTKWAGKTVHFAVELDSTNEWLKRMPKEEAPHGTLALAEYQTAGKGRLGRNWVAPPGSNIAMSLLLRPTFSPVYAPMLTLVMGLSAAQAVAQLGVEVSIKWPNDIVVSGKKISGILTEMELEQGLIREIVIGIGINVNLYDIREDLRDKATSLYLETGKIYDRSDLVGRVMERFEENYERFLQTCDLSLLLEDYHQILANRGQPVRVLAEEPYTGVAHGINPQGELLVEKEDGTLTRVNSGEVSVRGLYSYV